MRLVSRVVMLMIVVCASAGLVAAESADEQSPYADGFGTPAIYFDAEGTPQFALTIAEIERDWQEYDSFLAPEEGMEYVILRFSITNLTDGDLDLYLSSMELVDSLGKSAGHANMVESGDFVRDELSLAAGETVEGSKLFEMPADRDPLMLLWKPIWNVSMFIHLGA